MDKFKHGDIVEIHAGSYACCVYYGVYNNDVKLGYVWESHVFDPDGYAKQGYLILPILVGYNQKIAFEIPEDYVPDTSELVFASEDICSPNESFTLFTPLVGQLKWSQGDWYYNEGKVIF